MIYNYRWLISNSIINPKAYLNSWKHFVSLYGLLNTIDYIEPITFQKRSYIRKYIKEHEKNYLLNISPYTKKYRSNYWRKKFYNAYLCNNLEEFYIANKDKIKDY